MEYCKLMDNKWLPQKQFAHLTAGVCSSEWRQDGTAISTATNVNTEGRLLRQCYAIHATNTVVLNRNEPT